MSLISASYVAARHNPFASHRVEAIPFCFAEGDWNGHIERLRSMNWRGAIVGQQGSGKTTLMLELKSRLDESSPDEFAPFYCFLSRDSQDHPNEVEQLIQAASRGQILLVDGIERLSWFRRRRLLRQQPESIRLVATAHGAIGLPVWIHCRTDWPLMRSVLDSLVDSPDELLVQEAGRLFLSHRGNIRDVLRSLYDLQSGAVVLHRESST